MKMMIITIEIPHKRDSNMNGDEVNALIADKGEIKIRNYRDQGRRIGDMVVLSNIMIPTGNDRRRILRILLR
jgi:hypothetical protein